MPDGFFITCWPVLARARRFRCFVAVGARARAPRARLRAKVGRLRSGSYARTPTRLQWAVSARNQTVSVAHGAPFGCIQINNDPKVQASPLGGGTVRSQGAPSPPILAWNHKPAPVRMLAGARLREGEKGGGWVQARSARLES